MIHLAIIDDNEQDSAYLFSKLQGYASRNSKSFLIDVYSSGIEFVDNYSGKHDIIFLDIDMPLMNGMEIAHRIRKIDEKVAIVFITKMAKMAVSGYEVNAIGFLVKPVTEFALDMTVKKALNYLAQNESINVVLADRFGVRVIPSSEILYIECVKHNLIYHVVNKNDKDAPTCYRKRGAIKDIEENLEKYNIIRCNNCYLVNLKYIRSIEDNVINISGVNLTVSRSKKREFMQIFMRYLGGKKHV